MSTAAPFGPDVRPLLRTRSGVYRVLGDVAPMLPELRAAGWRTAVLPVVSSVGGFYTAIAHAMAFPDHFGRNLDALWDCLTDLTEPTALLWPRWVAFATARPHDWSRVLGVLRERTELDADPPFALVLCDSP